MQVPESVIDDIRISAKEEWPDDKDMQVYTIKEELDAYKKFIAIDYSNVTTEEKQLLIEVVKESFDSWEERVSSIEDELEALVSLKEISEKI